MPKGSGFFGGGGFPNPISCSIIPVKGRSEVPHYCLGDAPVSGGGHRGLGHLVASWCQLGSSQKDPQGHKRAHNSSGLF